MPRPIADTLSPRERQLVDVLYARGASTVAEVLEALPDPPSYSTVRALLGRLESKGVVRHREEGPRYVYEPVRARDAERRSALRHVLETFFAGSTADAMAALLKEGKGDFAPRDLERLEALIDKARREGR
ncbi:MAG: BlaI/MecI/CopY family transcriptional regulator [Gemmatimonadaceae bacterium]|jgi:predicted transcriptional regulator|nr:BlaI/MecI/CopY family transcriptional regulator [Gemmatimonadaceae bacterium]